MTADELKIMLDSTFVIENPKSGTTWNIKPSELPFASAMYLIQYGCDQQNDTHSGVKKENFTKNGVFDQAEWAKQSDAKLEARIKNLREGNPPKVRTADPNAAVARQLANAMSGLDQAQAAALVAKLVAEAKKVAEKPKKDAA